MLETTFLFYYFHSFFREWWYALDCFRMVVAVVVVSTFFVFTSILTFSEQNCLSSWLIARTCPSIAKCCRLFSILIPLLACNMYKCYAFSHVRGVMLRWTSNSHAILSIDYRLIECCFQLFCPHPRIFYHHSMSYFDDIHSFSIKTSNGQTSKNRHIGKNYRSMR